VAVDAFFTTAAVRFGELGSRKFAILLGFRSFGLQTIASLCFNFAASRVSMILSESVRIEEY